MYILRSGIFKMNPSNLHIRGTAVFSHVQLSKYFPIFDELAPSYQFSLGRNHLQNQQALAVRGNAYGYKPCLRSIVRVPARQTCCDVYVLR
jgi:hypothetical protein